jgi:ppGpp synthetase/RelA/SpoT-type nucleotidyltranferase
VANGFVKKLSKSQVDKLGNRLRSGNISDDDLRLLDEYRRSHTGVYQSVVDAIRARAHVQTTGRPAKSTSSIVAKLQRESARLSQVQDIAGCRIVVTDPVAQDALVAELQNIFPQANLVDRRVNPSNGYRAVHMVVSTDGYRVEVQVRTKLQHLWAEYSEKLSDVVAPEVKYGGGPIEVQEDIQLLSRLIREFEEAEQEMDALRSKRQWKRLSREQRIAIGGLKTQLEMQQRRIGKLMRTLIAATKKRGNK